MSKSKGMDGETTGNDLYGASTWSKWKFYVAGWWACMVRGKMDKYNLLCAQAMQSSGVHYQLQNFWEFNSPWRMYPNAACTRSSGTYFTGTSEKLRYDGFLNAWYDRLDWEVYHEQFVGKHRTDLYEHYYADIASTTTAPGAAPCTFNALGDSPETTGTPSQRKQFAEQCTDIAKTATPALVRMVSNGFWPSMPSWVWILLLVLIILAVLWTLKKIIDAFR